MDYLETNVVYLFYKSSDFMIQLVKTSSDVKTMIVNSILAPSTDADRKASYLPFIDPTPSKLLVSSPML